MTTWWSDEKIKATVTAEYISRELQSKVHQATLDCPLGFGDSLTDDTYLDWILQKGRRLFLILNHIGCPEWIFEIIDKTLDDDDLPLSEDALKKLNLFGGRSETLDKKFYRQQYKFLVIELQPGGHVDYGDDDILPLESIVRRVPGISTHQEYNRVYVPKTNSVYTRRKISTSGENGVDREHFVMHMKALQTIKHPHLVSIWATYTKSLFSYVLLTPSLDLTLKSFLDEQPKAFKHLSKLQRRETLIKWTHCLTSALSYLHEKGFAHQAIRPSTVTIDDNFNIYLNDFGALKALDTEGNPSPYNCEIYDHAAPEIWVRTPCIHESAPLRTTLPGGGRTTYRLHSEGVKPLSPYLVTVENRRRSDATSSCGSSTHSRTQKALITTFSPPRVDSPPSYPADVFSLTTILLQLVSLVLSQSPKKFAAYRSCHNRHAGRGGAPADASFHVNLTQVVRWMDFLRKEAAGKHWRDKKRGEFGIWQGVGGIVDACRGGMRREPGDRIRSRDMERQIREWVDKALGDRRERCCGQEDEAVEEANGWVDMRILSREPNPSISDKGVRGWLKRTGRTHRESGSRRPSSNSAQQAEVKLMRAFVGPEDPASPSIRSLQRLSEHSDEGTRTLRHPSGEVPDSLRSMSISSTALSGRTFEHPDDTPKTPQHDTFAWNNAIHIHRVDEDGISRAFPLDQRRHEPVEETEDNNWPLGKDMEFGATFLCSPGESMVSVGESMIRVGVQDHERVCV